VKQQLQPSQYHLKPSEVEKCLNATPNFRDRCLIKALYYAGLRREEVTKLDVRDLDFDRKRMTVRAGKRGKTRVVPIIDQEFLDDLKRLVGARRSGPVFLSTRGGRLTPRAVNKIVAKAGERAGLTPPNPATRHINPHLFRHSIARYLKSKGFSAEWIQKFLGHASYKTTMDMYGTLSLDEMQEEAEKRLANPEGGAA